MGRMQAELKIDDEAEIGASGPVPGVQALTRGVHLLELVASAAAPPRFTDLLEGSGMPKGTLHRILQALVDERLLKLDSRDQTYRLGSRLFQWAHRVWDDFDLRGAAEPELERLRDLTGEAIRLGVMDGGSVLYIDQREVPQPLRLNNGVGSRASAYASGLGKAILAHMSLEKRRALLVDTPLEALTPHTTTDFDELIRQLDLTKARGYAVSIDEQNIGISSVAAPVLNHRGEPIGAIGIIGPSFRLPAERLHAQPFRYRRQGAAGRRRRDFRRVLHADPRPPAAAVPACLAHRRRDGPGIPRLGAQAKAPPPERRGQSDAHW